MKTRWLLEIAVETLEAAVAAEHGGADRIELCADLSVGGLTPDAVLMRKVRERVRLPIFAMIRPRGGDFVYSDAEYAQMQHSIGTAKVLGMDGLVFGILNDDGRIDVARTKSLVNLARPLPTTFHRAFDVCATLESLEDVVKTGASRILTSGGASAAPEGLTVLGQLVAAAVQRIVIVPGGGINASNLVQVARHTHAREFHSGLSTELPYPRTNHDQFQREVEKLAKLVAALQ